MKRKLIAGTRGSKLAMIQTESVVTVINKASPGTDITIKSIVTGGDKNKHTPLEAMAGQGIFVKELEEALLNGRIDLAVHSLKDMPGQLPDGLCLAVVLERSDPRDVLISRDDRKLAELPHGARIGTGSQRRAAQLTAYRPDLKIINIRGNVDTRINNVNSGDCDGVVLAAAALKRLGWADKICEYLPIEVFLPAVGQGALAIETRCDDKETAEIIAPLNHLPTWQCITAERAFLRKIGGGCKSPIAALGTIEGIDLHLDGMIIDGTDNRVLRSIEKGSPSVAEEMGLRLGQRLLAEGI